MGFSHFTRVYFLSPYLQNGSYSLRWVNERLCPGACWNATVCRVGGDRGGVDPMGRFAPLQSPDHRVVASANVCRLGSRLDRRAILAHTIRPVSPVGWCCAGCDTLPAMGSRWRHHWSVPGLGATSFR